MASQCREQARRVYYGCVSKAKKEIPVNNMRQRTSVVILFFLVLPWLDPGFGFATDVVGTVPGTFTVSLAGSSSYSMPIRVAPGSAGTQPKIELTYDSQSFGGALGAGWSIRGFSAIARGPRDQFVDGRPGAVGLSEQDALYLDGQRIVPISAPTGAGVARQVEYRKVNDDFTQILQYGSDLNHSYFRVKTKG